MLRNLWGILGIILVMINNGLTQEYLWPTDASRNLSSSFAEYRPGHFHAGIDIKTWGRTGYKVFAIHDGYIVRLSVSPFGYGKVLYQKIDTGETVVYAHLDRFNDRLHQFVKQEQRRQGAYRINRYLSDTQFIVKKGDLLGYTGASGIGSPHLHFEVRDPGNRPMNPFLLGYKVEDTIPPTVNAISISPLNHNSRVNSDVTPFIVQPILISKGNYTVPTRPLISGHIGFAVNCFDQANGATNTFAIYKTEFYVDSVLYFSATYDKFSYDVSQFVDFDRDYRLISRGKGTFQKLYKEKLNQLSFYHPAGNEVGILKADPASKNNAYGLGHIGIGEHQYVIILSDFFGNVTLVTGSFVVKERATLVANFDAPQSDQLRISHIYDQDKHPIMAPEFFISLDQGGSWQRVTPQLENFNNEPETTRVVRYVLNVVKPLTTVKIQAADEYGIESFPLFHTVREDNQHLTSSAELTVETDFYDDYIRLQLNVTIGLIQQRPRLFVQQTGAPETEIGLWQTRFNEFIGVYQLVPGKDGLLLIKATAIDISGRVLNYEDQLEVQTVFPDSGGEMISDDGQCRVRFESGSVYQPLFLRISRYGRLMNSNYDNVGEIYEIFPQDVPLKEQAVIQIRYPGSDTLPAKLGIYRLDKATLGFTGNQIDLKHKTISGKVSNLGEFTLIRDVIPPFISLKSPANNSRLSDATPNFLAVVDDELSGIADERSIVMKLDGEPVIAEYDPEAKSISYQPDTPLSPGRHIISVWATDRSRNEARVSHQFHVTTP